MSVKVVFSFIISGVFSAYDYIYINSKKTFADANAYCKTEFGTSLAIIDTAQDNALIKSRITNNGDVWIGINDLVTEGVFKNADGSSLSYTNWKTSEPNNLGNEDCTVMNGGTGKWNDAGCGLSTSFVCTIITVSPTSMPTTSPTKAKMFVKNVCELLDIDFFLGECSIHHGKLKTSLANNTVNDLALKERVMKLENTTSANESAFTKKINEIQAKITDLKNTIKKSLGNLATTLGNLGSTNPAKIIPIFGDNGQIIGRNKLFFTSIQAQYLIMISLFINVMFLFETILHCICKNRITTDDIDSKPAYNNNINTFDSSDDSEYSFKK